MNVDQLRQRFATELLERPWLKAFFEDGDQDLEPAKKRWSECQHRSRLALRSRGVELHRRIQGRRGLSTTAIDARPEGDER